MKMRMIAVASLAVLATSALAPPAFAQNQMQRDALRHAAQAMTGSTRCSSVQPNLPFIWALLSKLGIKPRDIEEGGRFYPLMLREAKETADALGRNKEEDICNMLIVFYGPSGSSVPNFVK
jgi:hypothetical protein